MKIAKILYVIGATLVAGFCMYLIRPTPEKPKRLVEVIADNIKEHTADWTFIEEEDTLKSHQIYRIHFEEFPPNKIWENKKCGIKIMTNNFFVNYFQIVSPDTLTLDGADATIITDAYFEAVEMPKLKIENHRHDSLQAIEKKKIADKEAEILSKICTK